MLKNKKNARKPSPFMKDSQCSKKQVRVHKLKTFCIEAMLKSGMKKNDAETTADVLVTADTLGIFTHGAKQLRLLVRNVRSGRIKPKTTPEIVGEGLAWAIVDGHFAMPMVSSKMAMKVAIKKAKSVGVSYVGVKNSSHFGTAGYYANMAAEQAMIGLAMSNVELCMTAPGAKGAIIGNNPLAYAVPAGKEKTVLLDIAMSNVAAGKVFSAVFSGTKMPDDWAVDAEGNRTTDPNRLRDFPRTGGALLPMGKHKGYGLAIIVEILAGVLTGAAVTQDIVSWLTDSPTPTNEGHAFIAIDIATMMPLRQFKDRMDKMIQQIKNAPKAKGADRIFLPGEKEWENQQNALRNGILLPEHVVASLVGLAEDVKLDIRGLFE